MMRCPASCRLKTTEERDWPSCVLANKTWRQLKSHLHQWVHVEEFPDSQPEHTRTELPPRFACPDSDEWDKDDWLLVWFIGAQPEEITATQNISQKLAKTSEGASLTHFEDIVPKPCQEFRDVFFTKESFDELPNQQQWDHAIELAPDAHNFSTKVYPLAPVEQKQLDKFLDENLKSQCICPSKSSMASLVFFIKKTGACTWSKTTKSLMWWLWRMPTPSLWSQISLTKSQKPKPNISQNWTSIGLQ